MANELGADAVQRAQRVSGEQRAWQWPAPDTAIWLLAAIAVGAEAYASLMIATRTGDVSVVTPFRYTRLVFGLALGVLVLGEQIET